MIFRLYAVITAVVGRSADHLLAHCMKDDRLITRNADIVRILREEADILLGLPQLVWRRLRDRVTMVEDAHELRQIALRGQLTMYGGVRRRVLNRLEGEPFCLAEGDVAANVRALAEQAEEPTQLVHWKAWRMLKKGVPDRFIVGAVNEFPKLRCSSIEAEQGHIAVSLQRRYHKQYHTRQLLMKAFIYSAWTFWPAGPPKKKERLTRQSEMLDKKRPEVISSYNVHVHASSKANTCSLGGVGPNFEEQQDVMKDIGRDWHDVPAEDRDVLHIRALEKRKRGRTLLNAKKEKVADALEDIEAAERMERLNCGHDRAHGIKFSEDVVREVEDVAAGCGYPIM